MALVDALKCAVRFWAPGSPGWSLQFSTVQALKSVAADLRLQLCHIRRILARHPEVEYHVWNLARTDDDQYVREIRGEGIIAVNKQTAAPLFNLTAEHAQRAMDQPRAERVTALDKTVGFAAIGQADELLIKST